MSAENNNKRVPTFRRYRFFFVGLFFLLLTFLLVARILYLTVVRREFLIEKGNARVVRMVEIPAERGGIVDRNGNPLAVTTSVYNIWVDPHVFNLQSSSIQVLSKLLNLSPHAIVHRVQHYKTRQFLYLKRDVSLNRGKTIAALNIDGLYLQDAYHRYYPQAAIFSQVVGFTNVDNQGQEGLELQYNDWLSGTRGEESVIKDRKGHVVARLNRFMAAKPGHQLTLTLDQSIQYLAYMHLKQVVNQYHAQSGSVVVMDPRNGEILAMANLPDYDPNQPQKVGVSHYRNRAVTDVFEPGSTLKTFSIASALSSGRYTVDSKVNTGNGLYAIGGHTIHDDSVNGVIDLTQILQKSSNIGAAKLTLTLPSAHLIHLLRAVGFGEVTASGFPGEVAGKLPMAGKPLKRIELATLSFGYGMMVTTLQLAKAYSVMANHGRSCPITLIKRRQPPNCHEAIQPSVANKILTMLHAVVAAGGTGYRAKLPDYTLAGKTGTAYIAKKNDSGYDEHEYTSSFVAIAPVTHPRIVVALVIRKPQGAHFGAIVAAPAVAKIVEGVLHSLAVPADKFPH